MFCDLQYCHGNYCEVITIIIAWRLQYMKPHKDASLQVWTLITAMLQNVTKVQLLQGITINDLIRLCLLSLPYLKTGNMYHCPSMAASIILMKVSDHWLKFLLQVYQFCCGMPWSKSLKKNACVPKRSVISSGSVIDTNIQRMWFRESYLFCTHKEYKVGHSGKRMIKCERSTFVSIREVGGLTVDISQCTWIVKCETWISGGRIDRHFTECMNCQMWTSILGGGGLCGPTISMRSMGLPLV